MKLQKASKQLKGIFLASLIFSVFSASATIVQFETNLGNFEVNLYDNDTPLTVANFLRYVEDGDYSNVIFHRTVPGFILQGGGFDTTLTAINTNPAVDNEPVFSNVRATIAMAKLPEIPNSATNQWFINVADNSNGLDAQNGGFTVFGQVINDGMIIVDSVMDVPRFNLGGVFGEIPLQNFDPANAPDETNFITITSIQVIDAAVDTTAGLTRPLSARVIEPPLTPDSSSGGGAFSAIFALLLLGRVFRRRA